MVAPGSPSAKPRWLRFSLRTLLIVVVGASVLLGWLGIALIRPQQEHPGITRLRSLDAKLLPIPGLVFGETELSESRLHLEVGDDPLARLPGVSLGKKGLNDHDLRLLSDCSGLRSLVIKDGPGVTDNGLKHLTAASKLCYVSLFNTQLTGGGLSRLPARNSIQLLRLEGPAVTDGSLANLDKLPSLRDLSIGDSRSITDAGMVHLSKFKQLDSLSLRGTAVTDRGLAHLSGLTGLQSLMLAGGAFSDEGMQHIGGLTELQSLRLSETSVGDVGVGHLARLEKLRNLDLTPSAVTDAGLQSLSKLSNLKNLMVARGVTRAGAVKLKGELPQCEIWFWEDNNWATLK